MTPRVDARFQVCNIDEGKEERRREEDGGGKGGGWETRPLSLN